MNLFIGFLLSIGVLIYGIGQWRLSRNVRTEKAADAANSTIDLLNKRADAFEKELKESKQKQAEHHDEIIRLQEQLKHKDEQIKQYLEIITYQNPDLKNTLKEVRDLLVLLNTKFNVDNTIKITQ